MRRVAEQFSVAMTEEMAALIDPGDPADPIAAQFVPSAAELETGAEEQADPIGDERWSPVAGHRPSLSRPGAAEADPGLPGLLPLLLPPRAVVGKTPAMLAPAALERAYDYIRERPEIWEVIVTGGDPFVLAPRRLRRDRAALDAIPHLGVIRFHTRVPIVDPRRVVRRA